jgi:hypothetical protein
MVEVRSNPLNSSIPSKTEDQSLVTSAATNGEWPKLADGKPDFDQMNATQRTAYHGWRLKRTYG